jgi:hypothetical protein
MDNAQIVKLMERAEAVRSLYAEQLAQAELALDDARVLDFSYALDQVDGTICLLQVLLHAAQTGSAPCATDDGMQRDPDVPIRLH